jgi:hypothetical protein
MEMMMIVEETDWQRYWALEATGEGIVHSPNRGRLASDHDEYCIPLGNVTVTR